MGIAKHAKVLLVCVSLTLACSAADQSYAPEIVSISPTSGPEGSRVEIAGKNFQDASAVLFGTTGSTFKLISPEKLIALAPRWVTTSAITVVTPSGRATSAFAFAVSNDPRVPDGVGWRAGYVNPVPPPRGFNSVLLWGIAIADTRLPGHQSAEVEIARTQLFCRVDGQEVVLNDDRGSVRGGLYLRQPWFGGNDYSEPMPLAYDPPNRAVVLRVGSVRTASGTSGVRPHEPGFRPANSKAARSRPASKFHPELCCSWAWITGVPLPHSGEAPA